MTTKTKGQLGYRLFCYETFDGPPLFHSLAAWLVEIKVELKSDCIYHFQIDLEPNGCQFGAKSIVK